MTENFVDSIINNSNESTREIEKVIELDLGLIYPELPTKYYVQAPLPKPKKVGSASLLVWLLYSNKLFLDSRWFQDHPNFWAKGALMKLTPLTRFFHWMAILRPTIQRSWLKVIWIIIRFIFVILTIIGVVGLTAFNSGDAWSSHLVIGLLATGLGFTSINILFWLLSFVFEKYYNKKWHPSSKNKRFFSCLEELIKEAKQYFKCTKLTIKINVIMYDDEDIFGIKKVSKKTQKQQKSIDKDLNNWKKVLAELIDAAENKIPSLNIVAMLVKKTFNNK